VAFVGAPIFFAAACFALLFRERSQAGTAFGWNLLGAVAGGLLEFTSMAVGLKALLLVALAAYLGAALVHLRRRGPRLTSDRDETGGSSKPAAAPAPEPASERGRARGEEYWRREAERVRDRLRPLRERASELRFQIEEKRRQPPPRRGGVGPQMGTLQRRLSALEERIREAESRFEDRARRERALPGWIR